MDGTNTKQNAITSNTYGAVTSKNDISRTRPHSPNLNVSFFGQLNTPLIGVKARRLGSSEKLKTKSNREMLKTFLIYALIPTLVSAPYLISYTHGFSQNPDCKCSDRVNIFQNPERKNCISMIG